MCCFSKVPGLFIGWTVDSFHNVVRDLEIKKKIGGGIGRAERDVLIENEGSEREKKERKSGIRGKKK